MEEADLGAPGYKKLKAWHSADTLAVGVFTALNSTQKVPPWLAHQMVRAAVSVPANIAEGYSRGGLRDYLRFLDIARGSLGEVEYYLHFADKLHLLDTGVCSHLSDTAAETGRLLFGLIRALSRKEKEGGWDRSRGVKEEGEPYLAEDQVEAGDVEFDTHSPSYDYASCSSFPVPCS